METKKLTKAQAGRLGGLANVRKNGTKGLSAAGSKGGATTYERYGAEHFVRCGLASRGYNVKTIAEASK